MKKLFYLIVGRWRILCDVCPWCKSDAPGLHTCPVCKCNTIFPLPKELKELWWIRYAAKVKLAELEKLTKPPAPETPPPAVRYFTGAPMDPLEEIMKEFIVPGLINYRNRHGFYPPTEIRLLRNVFHRPDRFPDDEWDQILQKVSDKIKRLEEGL